MKKSIILLIFSIILLILPLTQAAEIYGNIYNLDLDLAQNTILKINTIPEQTYVSKEGTYQFNVPEGKYTIRAEYTKNNKKYSIEKEIIIKEEGSYISDLILLPDISDIDIQEPVKTKLNFLWYIFGVIIVVALFFLYKKYKLKPKRIIQEDELPKKVLKFIKEQGGRITQKDIRKKFPMSEAKISLVITELEHKGIIKKIKKGRGNVIILN